MAHRAAHDGGAWPRCPQVPISHGTRTLFLVLGFLGLLLFLTWAIFAGHDTPPVMLIMRIMLRPGPGRSSLPQAWRMALYLASGALVQPQRTMRSNL